jgi:squalene cyclase
MHGKETSWLISTCRRRLQSPIWARFQGNRPIWARFQGNRRLESPPTSLNNAHVVFFQLLVLLCCSAAAPAAEKDPDNSAARLITPAAERSIDRGLKWLVAQQHEDGGFGAGPARGNAAVCALAGMAMLSGGSTPGRGPYGGQLNRCVEYLLQCAQPSGFIAGPNASSQPMYGHGFATMFLAECCGMSPRPELREKLAKAVNIIVNSQNKEGGWRYKPVRDEADISVTVCEIMALRAARNAGLFVPNETIDRSIDYVKRSQNADGGFMYRLQSPDVSAFPRSAAAVTALYSAGIYKVPEIDKGLNYLGQFVPAEGVMRHESYYFYGQYYAAQAMWQAGGPRFARWYPAVRDELIGRQRDDGSWPDAIGNECAAAMALIVLQIPNNCLPILQR